MLSVEENDRLIEILFFLYFNDKSEVMRTNSMPFWEVIKALCNLYDINYIAIVQSIRVLNADENCPTDKEIYYLLNKAGLSVRPIRKISGIYWQKQKEFAEEFEVCAPGISRRLTDVVYKKSIRDFVFALYDVIGIFSEIPKDILFAKT